MEKKKFKGIPEELKEICDPKSFKIADLDAWSLAREERQEEQLQKLFGDGYSQGKHKVELIKGRLFLSWSESPSPAEWLDLPMPLKSDEPFLEGVIRDLSPQYPLNITFCLSRAQLMKDRHLLRLVGESRRTDEPVFCLLVWLRINDYKKLDFSYAPINKEAEEIQNKEPDNNKRRYIESIIMFIAQHVLLPPESALQHVH